MPARSESAPVPRRSRRTDRAVRTSGHRGETSPGHLHPLVGGAAIYMDHLKFVGHAQQTLGMADKQIAAWVQAAIKLFDQPFLLGLVEIHHDVAAENHIVALRQVF